MESPQRVPRWPMAAMVSLIALIRTVLSCMRQHARFHLLGSGCIPIRGQDLESFRLIQPQPKVVVPVLFESLFQFEFEALPAAVMHPGVLECCNRQLERAGTADVVDVFITPDRKSVV